MIVRRAVSGDATAIAEVHVRSWQGAFRGLLPDDALHAMTAAQRRPMWDAMTAPGRDDVDVCVADDDGRIVGFFSGHMPGDDDDAGDAPWMLKTIYLDPATIGRGVGSALLCEFERLAAERGHAHVVLRVIAGNDRAIAFYERHGWARDIDATGHQWTWGVDLTTWRFSKRLVTPP